MSHSFTFSGKNNLTDSELSKNHFQNSNFTLQCWIQTTTVGEILSKQTNETSFALRVNSKGHIVFTVANNENTRTITATNVSVLDNEWYHITAVKTTTFLYLYINDLKLIIENSEESVSSNSQLDIFSVGGNVIPNFFHGIISQVAIWNKALLENEVALIREQEDI